MTAEKKVDHKTRLGLVAGQLYTLAYIERGRHLTVRHMEFRAANVYGLTFWQHLANNKSREHVFDGPEIESAGTEGDGNTDQ